MFRKATIFELKGKNRRYLLRPKVVAGKRSGHPKTLMFTKKTINLTYESFDTQYTRQLRLG
jgi:hypothetical protein